MAKALFHVKFEELRSKLAVWDSSSLPDEL
ncbi:hypothetical protein A2U01_0101637, partial [Trifolium medium]|nr:hypothetical protein [Trifolium medium]